MIIAPFENEQTSLLHFCDNEDGQGFCFLKTNSIILFIDMHTL